MNTKKITTHLGVIIALISFAMETCPMSKAKFRQRECKNIALMHKKKDAAKKRIFIQAALFPAVFCLAHIWLQTEYIKSPEVNTKKKIDDVPYHISTTPTQPRLLKAPQCKKLPAPYSPKHFLNDSRGRGKCYR